MKTPSKRLLGLCCSVTLTVVAGLTAVSGGQASAESDPIIAAAGDIACPPGSARTAARCHQMETANLIGAGNYAAVLPLGDVLYDCGALAAFGNVYDSSWGRFNDQAHPIVGDNEYEGDTCTTPGAAGYFSYFGDRATPDQPGCRSACDGYYSYDIGSWHLVALNSECTEVGVGGCSASDPMGRWLQSDLAAHPTACTLAYMHTPYWSSSGVSSKYKPLAQLLYDGGVDVLLTAHNHLYTRFAPQTPNSAVDADGLRQFTVGTGGKSHGSVNTVLPNIQKQNTTTFGILKLTLHPTGYDFAFVPDTTSGSFTDSGTGTCSAGSSSDTTPGAVTSATVLNGSTTDRPISVTVRYAAASGAPTGYRISVIDQTTGAETAPKTVAASVLRTKITGLVKGRSYQAKITAFNSAGDGPTVTTSMAATAQ